MNTTSQCTESSISNLRATPLKKRIINFNSNYTDTTDEHNKTDSIATNQDVMNNIQETDVKFSPEKENKIDRDGVQNETISEKLMNINICENKEIEHNGNVQNNLGSQNISSMKINNIHSTSKKTDNSLHNLNNTNYNNKIDNNLNDKNMLCLKELQYLLKSPPSKKTEKLQSENIDFTNGNLEKKDIDDFKQFCNTLQQETYSGEELNSKIEYLLEDVFNTAISAEDDIKVSSDILLSSMTDINVFQYIDDGLTDLNKDPLTDPLLISEEKAVDSAFIDSDCKPLTPRRSSCKRSSLTINYNKNNRKQKRKLSIEEKKILRELENVEEEELPLSAIQQLASIHIKHIHKVPPQHNIEGTGASSITIEGKNLFKKYGPLRKGPYSPIEDKTISKNWETFCKLHNWDSKNIAPFLNWRHNGRYYIPKLRERKKFVQFIANGLPWRTLYSVYSRFKVLYCDRITNTRYTAKEDKKILKYIENKFLDERDSKYNELAKLLGRTRRSVSKRYKFLKRIQSGSVKESNVKWTLPLIKKFIKTLLSVTLSEHIEELKHITFPMSVWQKIEEKLNIDKNVLKTFWQHQLHLQLFSTSPIYLNDIKIQLIEYMYKKGISSTREIIWPNVTQHFEGATAVFLCKIFFYLVQECNMNDTDNFADIVEYLYHKKIPEIKNAPTDKFLPRIVYENGKIIVLNSEDDTTDTNTVDCKVDCDTDV